MKRKRIEIDSIGSIKIEKNRLWGAQTQRSIENFRIGYEKMPKELIISLGFQKKAAAMANIKLGKLDKKIGNGTPQNLDLERFQSTKFSSQ